MESTVSNQHIRTRIAKPIELPLGDKPLPAASATISTANTFTLNFLNLALRLRVISIFMFVFFADYFHFVSLHCSQKVLRNRHFLNFGPKEKIPLGPINGRELGKVFVLLVQERDEISLLKPRLCQQSIECFLP